MKLEDGKLLNFEEMLFEKAKQEGKYSSLSVEESKIINDRIAKGLNDYKNRTWNEKHQHHEPVYFNA